MRQRDYHHTKYTHQVMSSALPSSFPECCHFSTYTPSRPGGLFLGILSTHINLSCRFELWAARPLILAPVCPPKLCSTALQSRLDILPLFPLIPRKIHNEFAGGSLVEFYRALLQCMSGSSYHRHRDTDPRKGGCSRDS